MSEQDSNRPDVVTVYKDHANEWRWHRVAPNGDVISESGEGYVNKQEAWDAATEVNGVTHRTVEIKFASDVSD